MPKEKIYENVAVGNMDGHDCRVQVEWGRSVPRVTVHTLTDEGWFLRHPNEAAVDRVDPRSPGPPAEPQADFHGFGCVLDADALDHLIAALRRARKQAFGKPEITVTVNHLDTDNCGCSFTGLDSAIRRPCAKHPAADSSVVASWDAS